MSYQSITLRAKAMRLADVLSRVEINPDKPFIESVGKNKRDWSDALPPPKFKNWPEINMDYLLSDNSDKDVLYDDCSKGPALWPLESAAAFQSQKGKLRLIMITTLPLKVLRGKVRRLSPYNAAAYCIDIDQYGNFLDYGSGFFGLFAGNWTNLMLGDTFTSGCDGDRFNKTIPVMTGIMLAQRYEWSAVFQFKNGLKLRFGCSARGALELFKDRDRPQEGRRKSLLHWVRRHWRKTSDPDTAKAVRQHLRGITSFDWRGMAVCVIPSDFDLENAA